jgi:hypothetical protein
MDHIKLVSAMQFLTMAEYLPARISSSFFQTSPNAKVGFSKAMSQGWIVIDTSGGASVVRRKVPSIDDVVHSNWSSFQVAKEKAFLIAWKMTQVDSRANRWKLHHHKGPRIHDGLEEARIRFDFWHVDFWCVEGIKVQGL